MKRSIEKLVVWAIKNAITQQGLLQLIERDEDINKASFDPQAPPEEKHYFIQHTALEKPDKPPTFTKKELLLLRTAINHHNELHEKIKRLIKSAPHQTSPRYEAKYQPAVMCDQEVASILKARRASQATVVGFRGKGFDEKSDKCILELDVDGHLGDAYVSQEMWQEIWETSWGTKSKKYLEHAAIEKKWFREFRPGDQVMTRFGLSTMLSTGNIFTLQCGGKKFQASYPTNQIMHNINGMWYQSHKAPKVGDEKQFSKIVYGDKLDLGHGQGTVVAVEDFRIFYSGRQDKWHTWTGVNKTMVKTAKGWRFKD